MGLIKMGVDDVTICNFQTGDNSLWGRSERSKAVVGEAGRAQEAGGGGAGEAQEAGGGRAGEEGKGEA